MKKLRTLIRCACVWGWRLSVLVIVFLNLRLYVPSPLVDSDDAVPPALVAQLGANRAAIDAGCPLAMQRLFPEGYYFSYLFHGLTWVELAFREASFSQQAISEAEFCLSKLNSTLGKQPFPENLPPDHGMFYCAWKCSLRAGLVLVQQQTDRGIDDKQLRILRDECDAIAGAIRDSRTPFLASYSRAAWPCDTVPAIHALNAYDQITGEGRYARLIKSWLRDAKERLDEDTGLLPHTAELPDGRIVGVARATSQVILLRLLPDIDADFAKNQYVRFRDRFFTSFLGAPCVLEYPSGIVGSGDVDSGPLIFGRSITGTVMTMGVANIYGDHSVANAIAQAGETVGLPWTTDGNKRYVGGVMPIGEIIVAYSHVSRPWFSKAEHHPDTEYRVSRFWRLSIHAVSTLVLFPLVIQLLRRRKSNPAEAEA